MWVSNLIYKAVSSSIHVSYHVARSGTLDVSATGEAGANVAVLPPVTRSAEGHKEPEESADEVDPDGILHALDAAVSFGVFMEEELQNLLAFFGLQLVEIGRLSRTLAKTPNRVILRIKRTRFQTGAMMPIEVKIKGTK